MPHHKNKTSFRKNDSRFRSRKWRAALSKSLKGNLKIMNQNHYNWKGGISERYLAGLVMKRDNFRCRGCGIKDPEVLEIDHIQPTFLRPDLRKDSKNMITLCANCHRRKTRIDLMMIKTWKSNQKNGNNNRRC